MNTLQEDVRRSNASVRMLLFAMVALVATTAAGCSPAAESPPDPGAASGADQAAGGEAPADSGATSNAPEVLIPAPDFSGIELLDQSGESIAFEALRGKPTLMSFIYTRCPMPTMCPATMLRFQEVQKALSPEERARVQLITVSFDPTYDTPEVLAAYAELWRADHSFWALLTGDEQDIHDIASAYGLWYEQTEDGNFDHSMYSMILFPDGSLHEILSGSMWSSEAAAAKLVEMAGTPDSTPR